MVLSASSALGPRTPGLLAAAVVALSLRLLPAQALAAEQVDGAFIVVEAIPDHVLLSQGRGANVELRIQLRHAEDVPTAQLVAHSTAGTITDLRSDGAGAFRATLRPPVEVFPQLAVVTVVDASRALVGEAPDVGTAVVEYAARIDLSGKTEAGAAMRVSVAGTTYGPVRADAAGRFSLPVVVPAGVGSGTGISTDELGNASTSSINFYLPEVRRLHAFAYPDALVADGRDTAWIFLTSVDASGAPETAPVTVRASAGALEPGVWLRPGLLRAKLTAPTAMGEGTVRVSSARARGKAQGYVDVALVAGAPASVELRVEPDPLLADGVTPGAMHVLVRDAFDNGAAGHHVVALSGPQRWDSVSLGAGAYRIDLPPTRAQGRRQVRLVVEPNAERCLRPLRVQVAEQALAVDVRGLPCADQQAHMLPSGGRVLAEPLERVTEVTWRLPTPVDLRLSSVLRSGNTVRATLRAAGIVDASRLRVVASHGAVVLGALSDGEAPVTVTVDPARATEPVHLVASDTQTGVSVWVVVP